MNKITIPIRGMHCASCEILVGDNIKSISGVKDVKVDHKSGKAEITFDKHPAKSDLEKAVHDAGYQIGEKEKLPWLSKNPLEYKELLKAATILAILYILARWMGILNLNVSPDQTSLFAPLLVGLVAGFSTCMALIGGLILGLSSRHAELHPEASTTQKFRPHLYFNFGRILGYGFLGGVIGLLGSAFKLSTNLVGILTIAVSFVMIFLGLKLIEIFPALRDKTISLPSGIAKIFGIKKDVKEYSNKSAMLTGALTFFLPCGFTQAMQLYAVSSGSFIGGALIMAMFAIGTAPGLLSVGGLTSVMKGKKARIFFKAAGIAVILFGWFNIANGSRLISLGNSSVVNGSQIVSGEVQEVRMTEGNSGYSPQEFTIEVGRPVRWIINATNPYSCASVIVVPQFNIQKQLKQGENIIEFTPKNTGDIPFSCIMGMYTGKFHVVEKGQASDSNNNSTSYSNSNANLSAGRGCSMRAAAKSAGSNSPAASSCGSSGGGCGGCGGGKPVVPSEGNVQSVDLTTPSEQVIKTTYTYNDDIQPNTFTVKKNVPVKLAIDVKENGSGCMSTIMIPGLYDQPQYLRSGNIIEMNFTPQRTGTYEITCAMGVPRGKIIVVE